MDEDDAGTGHRGPVVTVLPSGCGFGHHRDRFTTHRSDTESILRKDGMPVDTATVRDGIVPTVVGTNSIASVREVVVRWRYKVPSTSLDIVIVVVTDD